MKKRIKQLWIFMQEKLSSREAKERIFIILASSYLMFFIYWQYANNMEACTTITNYF